MPKLNLVALANDEATDALATQSRVNRGREHQDVIDESLAGTKSDRAFFNNVALTVAYEATTTTQPGDKIYSWDEIQTFLKD